LKIFWRLHKPSTSDRPLQDLLLKPQPQQDSFAAHPSTQLKWATLQPYPQNSTSGGLLCGPSSNINPNRAAWRHNPETTSSKQQKKNKHFFEPQPYGNLNTQLLFSNNGSNEQKIPALLGQTSSACQTSRPIEVLLESG
jgi:hypothetical protein